MSCKCGHYRNFWFQPNGPSFENNFLNVLKNIFFIFISITLPFYYMIICTPLHFKYVYNFTHFAHHMYFENMALNRMKDTISFMTISLIGENIRLNLTLKRNTKPFNLLYYLLFSLIYILGINTPILIIYKIKTFSSTVQLLHCVLIVVCRFIRLLEWGKYQ